MVLDTESGSYYARCLGCMEAGPECPNAQIARKALLVFGAARTEE